MSPYRLQTVSDVVYNRSNPTDKIIKRRCSPKVLVVLLCALPLAAIAIAALIFFLISRSMTDLRLHNYTEWLKLTRLVDRTFPHPPGTESLQCPRLFADGYDEDYMNQLIHNRLAVKDPISDYELPMTCDDVTARHYFNNKPLSEEEANYPLAFAWVVYTDYFYLELTLASMYSPQNHYCFVLDSDADNLFRSRIKSMASCFPNVHYLPVDRDTDSGGHDMDKAHFDCIEYLADKPWKYIVLLQNHDIPLKTNFEMVQIFKWLKGANDVQHQTLHGRVDLDLDWSMAGLNLIKNDTLYQQVSARAAALNLDLPPKITFAKGYNEVSFSRPMVDFLLGQTRIRNLIDRVDQRDVYGVDEVVAPTINSLDSLEVPGGFTQKCIHQGKESQHITRQSIWTYSDKDTRCKSKEIRHSICIFGVEDLEPNVNKFPHLFVNKLFPSFDFNAVICWLETLRDAEGHVSPQALESFDCHEQV